MIEVIENVGEYLTMEKASRETASSKGAVLSWAYRNNANLRQIGNVLLIHTKDVARYKKVKEGRTTKHVDEPGR